MITDIVSRPGYTEVSFPGKEFSGQEDLERIISSLVYGASNPKRDIFPAQLGEFLNRIDASKTYYIALVKHDDKQFLDWGEKVSVAWGNTSAGTISLDS